MDLPEIRGGLVAGGVPAESADKAIDAYRDAKWRYHLGDHRPNAVEGGHFAEAVFRILQHAAGLDVTPLGRSLPRVDGLATRLENIPFEDAAESVRIHIPRTLRLVYDLRNKRAAAHPSDEIDPNLQDATLVVGCLDWVMAELVRLYHDVSADEAQAIIDDLVVKAVPVVQEIDGQPVILKDLQARDRALLMLYRAGSDRGATLDELAGQLRAKRKDHLRDRLRRLDTDRLVLEHPDSGRFHITRAGIVDVEQRRLARPV